LQPKLILARRKKYFIKICR